MDALLRKSKSGPVQCLLKTLSKKNVVEQQEQGKCETPKRRSAPMQEASPVKKVRSPDGPTQKCPVGLENATPSNEMPTLLHQRVKSGQLGALNNDSRNKADKVKNSDTFNAELKRRLEVNAEQAKCIIGHIRALGSPEMSARYHAAEALAALSHKAGVARPALEKALLNDESVHVRKSAALALGEIGDEKAAFVLKHALRHDEDQFVRRRAEQALCALRIRCGV